MTIEQHQKDFGSEITRFVEITDKKEILSCLKSKMSCTWGSGQEYGNSEWIHLSSPSKQYPSKVQTIFVCRKELCG